MVNYKMVILNLIPIVKYSLDTLYGCEQSGNETINIISTGHHIVIHSHFIEIREIYVK